MEHLEQLRYSGLFESRVPRYTSYPPANRFLSAEGQLHQVQWLDGVPHGSQLSLYVHLPYCKAICWFCACRTQAAENDAVVTDYVEALLKELEAVSNHLPKSVSLSRLHLGGGTPTMIKPEDMTRLLDAIYSALPRSDGFDCSVEIDTTQVSRRMIQTLASFGMNRATVGVQDFDPNVQHAIGREQGFEQTFRVVGELRELNLPHIDMEMLYGLPKQSANSIAETAQQVLSMDPDRVAICEYAHLPNLAKRQILIDARGLPTAENAFLNAQIARHMLLSDGYEPIGIDHFVKPGDSLIAARNNQTLRRDFEGYSDNASYALIGLGASAISHFPQGYVQNASATSVYCDTVQRAGLAGSRGYDLSQDDQVVAHMIERIMCRFELDVPAIHQQFPAARKLVDQLLDAVRKVYGLCIDDSPERLVIKPEYHPLARMVCSTLDHLGERPAY